MLMLKNPTLAFFFAVSFHSLLVGGGSVGKIFYHFKIDVISPSSVNYFASAAFYFDFTFIPKEQ